jgi:hypothetical protein
MSPEEEITMPRHYDYVRCLVYALVILCVVPAWAAREKISGTIENIDRDKRTITLQTEQGQIRELPIPADRLEDLQLKGLQIGESVEVELEEQRVTAIRKKLSTP